MWVWFSICTKKTNGTCCCYCSCRCWIAMLEFRCARSQMSRFYPFVYMVELPYGGDDDWFSWKVVKMANKLSTKDAENDPQMVFQIDCLPNGKKEGQYCLHLRRRKCLSLDREIFPRLHLPAKIPKNGQKIKYKRCWEWCSNPSNRFEIDSARLCRHLRRRKCLSLDREIFPGLSCRWRKKRHLTIF